MPRKLPPHCERFVDRTGKVRVYFRRGKGARTPLPPDPTSQEFLKAYAAALAGVAAEPKLKRTENAPGTLGALLLSYFRSPDYLDLRDTTRAAYRTSLERLREHGHRSLSGMTREGIVTKMLQPLADRPGARLALIKVLRVVIRHGIETGVLRHDPSLGIKRPRSGEIRAWNEAEIDQFEAKWPIASRERLAFGLMLFTGQRRSDVHRMTWADVTGDMIRVVQQKTGARLAIPLHSELVAILQATPRQHVTILNTAYGQPFTVDGFSGFMRDAIREAGLPLECQPHGLRKAAGRRLAEAGCSAHEIMSVLGHKTLAEAERYTRDANQGRLAGAAIHKLESRPKHAK